VLIELKHYMNPIKNLIERKLLKNPTKILIELKHYMNPTKNLIERKLLKNPTKILIELKHYMNPIYQVFSGGHVNLGSIRCLVGFM
jgi:hypothetical protein